MHKTKTTIFLICLLFLFITSAQASHLYIDPEYQDVSIGETFTIDIIVDPEGIEICGAQYDLYFNNTLLNATEQTTGSFLGQDGVSTNIYANKINNSYSDTEGKIEYGEARMSVDYGVLTPGVLATITFEVIAEEESISELRLNKVKLSNNESVAPPTTTYTNGNVSINEYTYGDVDGFEGITTNDGMMIFMNITYPGDSRYFLTSEEAADCDIFPGLTTNDGMTIFMNLTYPGDPRYALKC